MSLFCTCIFRYIIHYCDPRDVTHLYALNVVRSKERQFTIVSENNVVSDKTYATLSELISDLKTKDKRLAGMPRLKRCIRPSEFDLCPHLTFCKLPTE